MAKCKQLISLPFKGLKAAQNVSNSYDAKKEQSKKSMQQTMSRYVTASYCANRKF